MKSVVFLSHSSKDSLLLEEVKKLILKACNYDIELFLSSDKTSMPYGKNWVHSLENALNQADLMFVFLTPNSIKSEWIYFESGYAYRKGIDVIPLGIGEIDLKKLNPPINLFQGFNLTSHVELNDIINIINAKINKSFPVNFTKVDFQIIANNIENKQDKDNASLSDILDIVFISVGRHVDHENNKRYEPKLSNESQVLYALEFTLGNVIKSQGAALVNGMGFKFFTMAGSGAYEIRIDPLLLIDNLRILKDVLTISFEEVVKTYRMELNFNKNYYLETDPLKISSRIIRSSIHAKDKVDTYVFKGKSQDLKFMITSSQQIKLIFELRLLILLPIEQLMIELLDLNILIRKK